MDPHVIVCNWRLEGLCTPDGGVPFEVQSGGIMELDVWGLSWAAESWTFPFGVTDGLTRICQGTRINQLHACPSQPPTLSTQSPDRRNQNRPHLQNNMPTSYVICLSESYYFCSSVTHRPWVRVPLLRFPDFQFLIILIIISSKQHLGSFLQDASSLPILNCGPPSVLCCVPWKSHQELTLGQNRG